MLKVNEHPWKFPDGRMVCGLTPLGKKVFFVLTNGHAVGWHCEDSFG